MRIEIAGPSWADLDQTDLRHVEQDLAGRQCRMQANGRDWFLELGDDRRILVSAPWRIISDGRIAFGSEDEGKWFGLAEPLSGRLETGMLLTGKGRGRPLDLTGHGRPDAQVRGGRAHRHLQPFVGL